MSRDTQFVLNHLTELEQLAEDVLTDKQQIIDLDKKRNQNREALRALQNKKKESPLQKDQKEWVCFGNTFMKLPQSRTEAMLKQDQKSLDDEIAKLRDDLKPKVAKLREMEGRSEVKGFDLKSLTREEALTVRR